MRVWSITCDGTALNTDTLRRLGCKFGNTFDDIYPVYKQPTEAYDVFAIFDICHMIKLARNAFSDMQELVIDKGKVEWNYVKMLYDLQSNEGLHLANKVSLNHVHWHNHKMKVKLAVQVLSSSVADALQFLMEMCNIQFINCSETISFIRQIDRLFEMLNSHSQYGRGYKKSITSININHLQNVAEDICKYLLKLKLSNGDLVIHSRRKTFVLGFYISVKSIFAISQQLLATGSSYKPTYRFSQDYIEILFSCIRQKGGWNNNPNCLQFQGSLRRLLIENFVSASKVANCTVPAGYTTSSLFQLKWSRSCTYMMADDNSLSDEQETSELLSLLQVENSEYKSYMLFYIAGFVVRKLSKSIACEQCSVLLFHIPAHGALYDHSYHLTGPYAKFLTIKNKEGVTIPAV